MKRGAAGLLVGLSLAAASFAAMGMGHGVYFVSAIVSAPFAVLGTGVALVATVAMATALAGLAGTRAGTLLLTAHWLGLVAVFRMAPDCADFDRFGSMPVWLQITAGGALICYAGAQMWLIRKTLFMLRGE